MKNIAFTLLAVFSLGTNAQVLDMDIDIDKGTLNLSFSDSINTPDISYTKPLNCNAELVIDDNVDAIKIYHSGSHCSEGYKITMVLPTHLSNTEVKLKNGMIDFSDLTGVKKLTSFAKTGMISATNPGVKISRTPDYAGAIAEYSGSGNTNVNLEVESGMITL